MKKTIICLLSIFLIANVAHANCSDGTVIKGKNGTSYCKSNIKMNWFSAFSWCESQEMTLATLEEACPGVQNSSCSNLAGTGGNEWVWTATPSGPSSAFFVYLSTGFVTTLDRTANHYSGCALCG